MEETGGGGRFLSGKVGFSGQKERPMQAASDAENVSIPFLMFA